MNLSACPGKVSRGPRYCRALEVCRRVIDDLLDENDTNRDVYADSAYRSAAISVYLTSTWFFAAS